MVGRVSHRAETRVRAPLAGTGATRAVTMPALNGSHRRLRRASARPGIRCRGVATAPSATITETTSHAARSAQQGPRESGYPAAANLNHHRARCRSNRVTACSGRKLSLRRRSSATTTGLALKSKTAGRNLRPRQHNTTPDRTNGHEDAADFAKHESQVEHASPRGNLSTGWR